jgi:type III pantothenate kinase
VLLAVDVGNSNVVVGLFRDRSLEVSWRMATDGERMPDEWWATTFSLAKAEGVDLSAIDGAIVSSVVPRLTPRIVEMVERRIRVSPVIVSTAIDLGIGVRVDFPEEVGADRIVNAAGVQDLYRAPAIVVDFGTATSFDVVSANGDYIGGAIAPGVQLALEALTGRAARLSAVELRIPERAIGSNTIYNIQSGTALGYLELVNGMLRRISEELGGDPVVVATGGLGELFNEHSPLIQAYEPDLTLHGLRVIYQHITRSR